MFTPQQKDQVTQTIGKIKDTLDNYYPGDNLKVAVEIYTEVIDGMTEDLEIAEHMKDYWMHLADGAEK